MTNCFLWNSKMVCPLVENFDQKLPRFKSLSKFPKSVGKYLSSTQIDKNTQITKSILLINQYIHSSDGKYVVIYQSDGNLVMYNKNSIGTNAIWSTNTFSDDPMYARINIFGEFTLRDKYNNIYWTTKTINPNISNNNNPEYRLIIQNDRNLVLYNMDTKQPLWASGTNIPYSGECSVGNC